MYHFELRPNRRNVSAGPNSWDKEFEKFFDVFSRSEYFAPACEILDEEKSYTIGLDIPGLKKEEIEIEVKDNHLHVTGERKAPQVQETMLRSERKYGKFSRVFSLPQNVNAESIQAKFENGVLEITLPKEEKSTTRKISITGWNKDSQELKN